MPKLIFNIHIPLLRINQPSVPFMGGHFWQLAFPTFNGLTLGAFTDHEASYQKTAPVFFNFEMDFEANWLVKDPAAINGALECKVATNVEAFEHVEGPIFRFFKLVHEHYIDPLWEILLLAAPTSHIVQPRHSITFITPDDPEIAFNFGQQSFPILSYRGDMDVEYIFKPEACGEPIDIQSFYELPDLSSLLTNIRETPELNAALESFKLANLPYLSRAEQLMITVAALESLMLPDIYSGLKRNFSARIAGLLATSTEQYDRLNKVCRKLYDYRSKTIHGKDTSTLLDVAEESNHYYGSQLLSNCLISLAIKVAEGQSINDILATLGEEEERSGIAALPSLHQAVINPSPWRLLHQELRRTATFSGAAQTATEKDTMTFWYPLIGLSTETELEMVLGDRQFRMTSLSGNDVISLEDKDIRRDFISQLGLIEHWVASLQLNFSVAEDFHLTKEHAIIADQFAIRNLMTVGLRLVGFGQFVDPELLGIYTYHGQGRYRQASVLRQSILTKMKKGVQETLSLEKAGVLHKVWTLLLDYYHQARHDDIDHCLNLYRRIHEQEYIPFRSRAKLLFATLESMLGRFRRWEDPIQLEDLVMGLVGDGAATRWFKEQGRKTRNGVAHGNWTGLEDGQWYAKALELMDALILQYLNSWMKLPDRHQRRPGRAFVRHAESLLES